MIELSDAEIKAWCRSPQFGQIEETMRELRLDMDDVREVVKTVRHVTGCIPSELVSLREHIQAVRKSLKPVAPSDPLGWLLKEMHYGQNGRTGYLNICKARFTDLFTKYKQRIRDVTANATNQSIESVFYLEISQLRISGSYPLA